MFATLIAAISPSGLPGSSLSSVAPLTPDAAAALAHWLSSSRWLSRLPYPRISSAFPSRSSSAQLLDAEAADWQDHDPAPFPAVKELNDYAGVTKELARRASAAAQSHALKAT